MHVGRFRPVTPREIKWLAFNFAKDLGANLTLVGTPVFRCVVSQDSLVADPLASTRLSSDAAIVDAVVKTRAVQKFLAGGINGCDYMIHCEVTVSDGQVLEYSGNLLCATPS